jgi:putative two-component system response regulator
MAIVDVYDALVSARPYKGPLPHEDAMRIIGEGRGTFFEPALVDAFGAVSDRLSEFVEAGAGAGASL